MTILVKKDINISKKKVKKTKFLEYSSLNMTYSEKLENSLKESIIIEQEYKNNIRTGYNNVNEMMRSIIDK